jgi:hypothetical protein
MLSEGRGLRFGNAKGRLSLSLGQGRQILHFWSAQGGLSASGRSVGATKMGNQGSLRGYEPVVPGDGVLVPGGSPGLASFPGHGGENQGVREIMVGGGLEVAQEAGKEARRVE